MMRRTICCALAILIACASAAFAQAPVWTIQSENDAFPGWGDDDYTNGLRVSLDFTRAILWGRCSPVFATAAPRRCVGTEPCRKTTIFFGQDFYTPHDITVSDSPTHGATLRGMAVCRPRRACGSAATPCAPSRFSWARREDMLSARRCKRGGTWMPANARLNLGAGLTRSKPFQASSASSPRGRTGLLANAALAALARLCLPTSFPITGSRLETSSILVPPGPLGGSGTTCNGGGSTRSHQRSPHWLPALSPAPHRAHATWRSTSLERSKRAPWRGTPCCSTKPIHPGRRSQSAEALSIWRRGWASATGLSLAAFDGSGARLNSMAVDGAASVVCF